MNRNFIPFICWLVFILYSCEKQETAPVVEVSQENSDCSTLTIVDCFTALSDADTSCIQMYMLRDSISYTPTHNYACIIPNLILEIDQLWINGSVLPASQVVTILVPKDVEVGTYPLLDNSRYDAFFVPTINADNFVAISGTLEIIEHDKSEKYIAGAFEFIGQNLNSAVLPTVEFKDGYFRANY